MPQEDALTRALQRPRWRAPRGPDKSAFTAATAYGMVGAMGATAAAALGFDPVTTPSWLGLEGPASLVTSLALGVALGAATIGSTRALVRRATWARTLHAALKPAVHAENDATLLLLATASGIAEELLFRGLLVPLAGVVGSALAFGILHQVRGRARWAWVAWATVMGLLFALVYRASGSLAGPALAHVMINAANLRFLRDADVAEPEIIAARAEAAPAACRPSECRTTGRTA